MASPIPFQAPTLSTAPVQLMTGANTIYAVSAVNPNAYVVYIKLYDALAANVNPATSVPAQVLTVPAATATLPGVLINDNVSYAFTTAITARCTVTNQNQDTVSPAASPDFEFQTDQVSAGAATPTGSAGGSLAGSYPNPTIAAGAITATEVAAANKDGASGTPSMRTLGNGAAQACAGNDSRLSDSRVPSGSASGDLTGSYPGPTVASGAITDTKVAAANKDGVAGTASMRTLGTGAQQACAGNDSRLSDSRAPSGAASGDLNGTFPNPQVVSTNGTAFAPSATIDATLASNITGVFPITQVGYTRSHVSEAATITIPRGDGIDRDSTASGTLTTIAFSGVASASPVAAGRIRLVVTNGPQTITIPTCRRLGSTVGTINSLSLNNGNHELSWITQPSGVSGALEDWLADSSDDIRQSFSNADVTASTGIRQLAQTGTMSAAHTVTMPAASAFPNGNGFWIVDESGTVGATNKITLARAGSDTINGSTSFDLTTASFAVFVQSDGVSKWTLPTSTSTAGVSDTAFASSWNGVTGTAPSKNAVYDQLHLFDTDDDGNVDRLKSAIIAAGGTGQAPLRFTSGTVATSPTAGDVEYDGKCHYTSHAASERGVVVSTQICSLTSAYTLTSQTAAQKLFNVPANGEITLAANTTYLFRCKFSLSSLSSTSGNFGFAIGGTATISSIEWRAIAAKQALNAQTTTIAMSMNNGSSNTALTAANAQTNGWATIEGIIRITTTGTIQPQVSLSVAAAATVNANSIFEIWPIGSDTMTTVGNWD